MEENKLLIAGLTKKLDMDTDSVEELVGDSKNTWNPNLNLNALIRINFSIISEELGAGLVRGYSAIVQDPNDKSWAYGYHLKQGNDGLIMDYHSVSKMMDTAEPAEHNGLPWKTEVYRFIDPIASCWPVAGSDFVGFNYGRAEKMFKHLNKDYFGYPIIHPAQSNGRSLERPTVDVYRHVCFKDQLGVCKEKCGSFWYSFDNFTEQYNSNIIQFADIDIEVISAMVPGNMTFVE
jgi:hypothetical protein|tara:strand:+ start:337 stop:1038 length:702 start_codon:yes stop_codon:yes gene_type:complete